jgi:hypothetical protein
VFGRFKSDRGPAAYPQVQGLFLVALSTHQIANCTFAPCLTSEHATLPFLLKELGSGDLLMVDRGLVSYPALLSCHRRGIHYVVRISAAWKPKVIKRLGQGDTLVEVRPSRSASGHLPATDRNTTIKARLLEFRIRVPTKWVRPKSPTLD